MTFANLSRRVEQPCQRCAARSKPCVYPTQEPTVQVPQSYLEQLDQTLQELTNTIRSYGINAGLTSAASPQGRNTNGVLHVDLRQEPSTSDSLVGNSTAEAFIHKLRETVSSTKTSVEPFEFELSLDQPRPLIPNASQRDPSRVMVDTSGMWIRCQCLD